MKNYTPARALRGKCVYMNDSGALWGYKFVRWVRMPMHTGGEDTNEIGVGALVYVLWRCEPPFNHKPPRGFKKGHFLLRPYWQLQHNGFPTGYAKPRIIRRPPPSRVKMYRDET